MKRIIFSALAIFLCSPVFVYAASIGGAETQGQGKLGIGLDQEFVFDKDGETLDETGTYQTLSGSWSAKTEIDKMNRTMMKASYGLLDNLDVYVKLGAAKPDYKEEISGAWTLDGGIPPNDQGTFAGTTEYKGEEAFAYGFGLKGDYDLENDWLIGCDLQYLRHRNDYKASGSYAIYNDAGTAIAEGQIDEWEDKATFYEWHVAPYIAKRLDNFVPYLGARYSDGRVEYKDEDENKTKIKADDNFGVFVGTDYKIGENISLNLEGRFIDETAMSFAAAYKF